MHVNYSNVVNPYESSSSSMGSTEVKLFILNSHMEPLEFPGLSVQFPSHYSVLVGLKTTTYTISTRTQSFLVISTWKLLQDPLPKSFAIFFFLTKHVFRIQHASGCLLYDACVVPYLYGFMVAL